MTKFSNFFLILLLTGCVQPDLIRTWRTTLEFDNQFDNILVLGLVNNPQLRSQTEQEMVYEASRKKLNALNGMTMFPPELGKPFDDIERVKERLRERGFDGILTVAFIDVRAERYQSPEAAYEPLIFYDRFRNYYYRTYELVYRPGYFSSVSQFFIETNFYELQGGTLVWSGRSNSFDSENLDAVLSSYTRAVFKDLYSKKIIAR